MANSLVCTILFLSTLFVGVQGLFAQWNPAEVFTAEETRQLESLNFQEMKTSVHAFLKNSWCSEEKATLLMELTALMKPKVCVEIGAWTGSSVLPVAATLQYVRSGTMYAIDAWSNAEAIKNLAVDDPNRAWWSQVNMASVKAVFDSMVKTWNLAPYCKTIQKPSRDALNDLPPIDFLHIDGNFSEEGSVEDVKLFLPKVRTGGYILLSNVFMAAKDKQPKIKAFLLLTQSCEIVSEIENSNAILVKKM